jgi:hypothetical protein
MRLGGAAGNKSLTVCALNMPAELAVAGLLGHVGGCDPGVGAIPRFVTMSQTAAQFAR